MSRTEVERFISDVNENEELLKELSEGVIGLDDLVSRAKDRGYSFTADEAKAFAASQGEGELSDFELEEAAGGQQRIDSAIVVSNVEATTLTVAVALIISFATATGVSEAR